MNIYGATLSDPIALVVCFLGSGSQGAGPGVPGSNVFSLSYNRPETRRFPRKGPPTGARPPKWTMHNNPPPLPEQARQWQGSNVLKGDLLEY
jgi:hypothetical protein